MDNSVIARRSILAVAAASVVVCLASAGVSASFNDDAVVAAILAWVACGAALLFTYAMLFLGIDMGTMLLAKLRRLMRRRTRRR